MKNKNALIPAALITAGAAFGFGGNAVAGAAEAHKAPDPIEVSAPADTSVGIPPGETVKPIRTTPTTVVLSKGTPMHPIENPATQPNVHIGTAIHKQIDFGTAESIQSPPNTTASSGTTSTTEAAKPVTTTTLSKIAQVGEQGHSQPIHGLEAPATISAPQNSGESNNTPIPLELAVGVGATALMAGAIGNEFHNRRQEAAAMPIDSSQPTE